MDKGKRFQLVCSSPDLSHGSLTELVMNYYERRCKTHLLASGKYRYAGHTDACTEAVSCIAHSHLPTRYRWNRYPDKNVTTTDNSLFLL